MNVHTAPSPHRSVVGHINFSEAAETSDRWTPQCVLSHHTKSEIYYTISVDNAGSNPWYAAHAMVWSDLYATAAELHPITLPHIPDLPLTDSISPRSAVMTVRADLARHMPREVHAQWESKLHPVEHLPVYGDETQLEHDMASLPKKHLKQYRFETQCGRLYQQAKILSADSLRIRDTDPEESIRLMYKADLKTFENWALRRSFLYGDIYFVQTCLLWDAVTVLLAHLPGFPSDPQDAISILRQRILWVLEPWERESFLHTLDDVTGHGG